MKKKIGVEQDVIHKRDFEREYLENEYDHNSIMWDIGRDSELLDGIWSFNIDQYDTCLRAKWYTEISTDEDGREMPMDYDFEQWEKVTVPSCWNMTNSEYMFYEGSAIYTRTFRYEEDINKKRVFLKIGAANYHAKVFINGKYIGCHNGGSTPFYIEVSSVLEKENRIIILVNNTRKLDRVPSINTDWFNYGGLYRSVEIIRVNDCFIRHFHCKLVDKKIECYIKVDGKDYGEATLKIAELDIELKVKIESGEARVLIPASPILWSPGNPKLYDVSLQFENDIINEKIGFREIKVVDNEIMLNGEKIYLRGIGLHEDSKSNGKAVTEKEIIESIHLAKEMNCNYIRLAHYPHTEKFARIADELGIMLWEEIPVYWDISFASEETYADAKNQLLELINRDMNRASVIIWSVGNENNDTDERLKFMSGLSKVVKEVDSSRLVSAACLVNMDDLIIEDRLTEYLDIIGVNEYYGWYEPDFDRLPKIFQNSKPNKPVVITEFGAGALAGHRGTKDDLFSEDSQKAIYQKQIKVLDSIPYIKGICPWILFDFRSPRRVNAYQKFFNRKGLVSGDRKHKKLAFDVMKRYYAKD